MQGQQMCDDINRNHRHNRNHLRQASEEQMPSRLTLGDNIASSSTCGRYVLREEQHKKMSNVSFGQFLQIYIHLLKILTVSQIIYHM